MKGTRPLQPPDLGGQLLSSAGRATELGNRGRPRGSPNWWLVNEAKVALWGPLPQTAVCRGVRNRQSLCCDDITEQKPAPHAAAGWGGRSGTQAGEDPRGRGCAVAAAHRASPPPGQCPPPDVLSPLLVAADPPRPTPCCSRPPAPSSLTSAPSHPSLPGPFPSAPTVSCCFLKTNQQNTNPPPPPASTRPLLLFAEDLRERASEHAHTPFLPRPAWMVLRGPGQTPPPGQSWWSLPGPGLLVCDLLSWSAHSAWGAAPGRVCGHTRAQAHRCAHAGTHTSGC